MTLPTTAPAIAPALMLCDGLEDEEGIVIEEFATLV